MRWEQLAIATLCGDPAGAYQRTSIIVEVTIEERDTGVTEFDVKLLGDTRAAGERGWKPGDIETGPNYHGGSAPAGKLPWPERGERAMAACFERIRSFVCDNLRAIGTRSDQPGKSRVLYSYAGVEEVVSTLNVAPPAGLLAKKFIEDAVGPHVYAIVLDELEAALVSAEALVPPGVPESRKRSDRDVYEAWKAGLWPDRALFSPEKCREQIIRLHQRLGFPVPSQV